MDFYIIWYPHKGPHILSHLTYLSLYHVPLIPLYILRLLFHFILLYLHSILLHKKADFQIYISSLCVYWISSMCPCLSSTPRTVDTLIFGGISTNIWIWSFIKCPSIIFTLLHSHSFLRYLFCTEFCELFWFELLSFVRMRRNIA